MDRNRKLDGVKRTIRTVEGAIEVTVLTIVYYMLWRIGYDRGIFPAYYGNGKHVLAGVYALLVLVLFRNFEGFKFGYMKLTDVIISQWIAVFITNFITYWQLCLIANVVVSPTPMLVLTIIDAIVVFICSFLYTALYLRLYVPKNMVMIYGSDSALTLKFKMDAREDKYHISGLISVDEGLETICRKIVKYDAVILNDVHAEIRNDILKFCYHNQIRTYVSPKLTDIIVRGATSISLFDTPLLLVRGKGLTVSQRFFKRVMDIVLGVMALILTAPIMLIVAIAIKCEDGGPVLFKQKRVTLNGKVFNILKFRSMVVNAEKDGVSQPATDHDPRITKVGSIIRAARIDELPQIINILKGDMSIVGPRPERVEHMKKYSEEIPEFDFRLKVKGGLTGYAQIYGKYNTSPYDKLRLDMMYIEHYSLLLDVKLILTTIRILMKRESTEGFDKLEELERMRQETLRNMSEEESDSDQLIGAGK